MLDQTSLRLLEKAGLTSQESQVYFVLLQEAGLTARAIATQTELKRPTVYNVLESLEKKGFVHQDTTKRVLRYAAADPALLAHRVQATARELTDMLPYFRILQRKQQKTSVHIYNGLEGLRTAFLQIHKPKEACYCTSIALLKKVIPEEVARWEQLYLKNKAQPNSRHLLTDTPEDRAFAALLTDHGQQVRFLPKERVFEADITLYDNWVSIASFDEEIHVINSFSKSLHLSFTTLFEELWKGAITT